MATLNCTLLEQHWNSGNTGWNSASGSAYAGAWINNGAHAYYPYRLRLRTPAFGGTSSSMTVNIQCWRPDSFTHTTANLRWALCKSNASSSSYINTYSAVTDANQIASGNLTINNLKSSGEVGGIQTVPISISTNSPLEPIHEYYLYIWTAQSPAAGASLISISGVANLSAYVTHDDSAISSGYCQLLGQSGYENGGWVSTYCPSGGSWGNYRTTMLTFKTPNLVCKSSNITFRIAMARDASWSSDVTLRYAICTSDANKAKYCNVVGDVTTDPYQVKNADGSRCTGTVNITNIGSVKPTYHNISINTTALSKGSGTYYLFLWAGVSYPSTTALTIMQPQNEYYIDASGNDAWINHTISITSAHSYTSSVVAATCTTGGYTKYTCSNCGHSYTGNTTAALGHKYVGTVVAPTCTTQGYTSYKCSVCGDTSKANDKYTAATGHKYVGTVVAPTCTTQGYTSYKCSVCGDTSKANDTYTAALGHNHVETSRVEATYTSDGLITYTCSRCGATKTEVIPKKDGGFVFIDNGSGWDAYMVYIDNGSGWDLYIPYIDDGSEWIILA